MRTAPTVAPFGTWPSPVDADLITARSIKLSQVRVDNGDTYWVESRPMQAGRQILLRRSGDGTVQEVLPMTPEDQLVDVRTRIHEYGGKAYQVSEGVIIVSHAGDGRVYKLVPEERITRLHPLTPAVGHRYGDFLIDNVRGLVYAVRERHTAGGVVNDLVAIPLDGSAARELSAIRVIVDGVDFVAAPEMNPAGTALAWIEWDQGEMPWSATRLYVAPLTFEGQVGERTLVAGGPGVSAIEPRWAPNGDLIHVDDSSGYWNFYRTEGLAGEDFSARRTRPLHPAPYDFSVAMWILGLHTYDFLDAEHLVCSWIKDGLWRLGTLRLANGQAEEWDLGWQPSGNVAVADGRVVLLAESPTDRPAVIEVVDGQAVVLRRSGDAKLDTDLLARAEFIDWQSADGATVYGYFYPPHSPDYVGLEGELPPLIVNVHGGPTAAARPGLDLAVQYWTSRGYAYLDVNYRGSTGYGRAYREALTGHWGEVDVADIIAGVRHVIDRGFVDPQRVAVRGASAGGYSALRAVEGTDVFHAATSLFGVTDLNKLRAETHKFEARYLDDLCGVDGDTAEGQAEFAQRSPLQHITQAAVPLLLLQGTADTIVPPNQSELLFSLRTEAGLATAMVLFEGEGHGFKRAESIRRAYAAEQSFYEQVFALPVEHAHRLDIVNM
ncbi:alpha/beta hydrolase family protein [Buchananella hordeovulneris]|uniref:alpha/beta hydrolase family protein n=1 Tax=Buchananella hordeovulneris TaxID=52770 RepID=UPI000F5FFD61|nr:S9 family peptidase [Buchananella hordeovulneris]RRD45330.1 S9 family peptidase [Buchananella hordeovulneris]